nr:uncharacterized protein LOC109742038 isoform X3 [Aegilops tauschii subsp. strangulata]
MDHDHSLSRAGYVRHVGQLDSMPGAAVACIEHPSRYILESKNKGAVRVVSPANNNTRRGDRSCLQPAAFQVRLDWQIQSAVKTSTMLKTKMVVRMT